MIPQVQGKLSTVLENLVRAVSAHCGVILLSGDIQKSQIFRQTLADPLHVTLLSAPYDTPWIRDRFAFAVRSGTGVRWYVPVLHAMRRPHDDKLVSLICAKPIRKFPISGLAMGNMIVGAHGLVFATRDIFKDTADPLRYSRRLGIKKWIFFDPFPQEQTAHADLYVRVLSPKLIAIAWNLSSRNDRYSMRELGREIRRHDRKITVLQIPIRSHGKHYASLLNWVQLGSHLIIPRYPITPQKDIDTVRALLLKHGFSSEYIDSPTLEEGGSLHCLSASVFV